MLNHWHDLLMYMNCKKVVFIDGIAPNCKFDVLSERHNVWYYKFSIQ